MQVRFRKILIACLCFAMIILSAQTAEAKTHRKHHAHRAHHSHHSSRHHKKTKSVSHGSMDVRTAQRHLIHLGYLNDKADGIIGPRTKAALRKFQRDQNLTVTGTLTTETYNTLVVADLDGGQPRDLASMVSRAAVRPSNFIETHPDFYGHTDPEYANPMITAPPVVDESGATTKRVQTLPTRYGKVETSEEMVGGQKRYDVALNGQSVLTANNQPSVIGISQTFSVGNEDAIIFTTYRDTSGICPYRHYLMTLNQGGNNLQEIDNCTRGYRASVNNGLLFIEFPEADDARAVGNTWRYDNGRLDRL